MADIMRQSMKAVLAKVVERFGRTTLKALTAEEARLAYQTPNPEFAHLALILRQAAAAAAPGMERRGKPELSALSTTPLLIPRLTFGSPFRPFCQASGQAQGSP